MVKFYEQESGVKLLIIRGFRTRHIDLVYRDYLVDLSPSFLLLRSAMPRDH